VQLEISDNGREIAKSCLGNVITGVGNAGMRERVRELGGSLEIRSDETGTILVVSIPAASANAEKIFQLKWHCRQLIFPAGLAMIHRSCGGCSLSRRNGVGGKFTGRCQQRQAFPKYMVKPRTCDLRRDDCCKHKRRIKLLADNSRIERYAS
jgi:hypothetical protein